MGSLSGWTGNILRIDLETGRAGTFRPDPELYRRFLGGRGLAGHFLAPESGRAWNDPALPLLLFAGPLSGCSVPASSQAVFLTRSPLTGTVGETIVNGPLAAAIKHAGLDGIILSGKCPRFSGIAVCGTEVDIRDADTLRRLTATARLKRLERFGPAVVCGPAAEKGIPFAELVGPPGAILGRGGVGLSLASKNLCFLAVRGNTPPRIARPDEFAKASTVLERLFHASPFLTGEFGIGRFGVPALFDLANKRSMTPTAAFRKTSFEHVSRCNAYALNKSLRAESSGCAGCPMPCFRLTPQGLPLPGFDALSHFTALLENPDPGEAFRAYRFCVEQGLDPVTAAAFLAFERQSEGAKERDRSIPEDLAHMMDAFASQDARDAHARPPAIKGLALPACDPRGACGLALAYAVSTTGADYGHAFPLSREVLRKPVAADRTRWNGKARLVKTGEDAIAAADSLTACRYSLAAASMEEYARILSAVTGEEFASRELLETGERIDFQERLVNARNGFSQSDDDLPRLFFEKSVSDAPQTPSLDRQAFLETRRRYYRIRGLDDRGLPDARKARKLGLEPLGQASVSRRSLSRPAPRPADAMIQELDHYAGKLVRQGLAADGSPLFAAKDDALCWNRHDPMGARFETVIRRLDLGSLLYAFPAEPYSSIVRFYAEQAKGAVTPRDCETRNFLHDIPVLSSTAAPDISGALSRRKAAILPGGRIVAAGAATPEQAYIVFSSVCFACFVDFFSMLLRKKRRAPLDPCESRALEAAISGLADYPSRPETLDRAPLRSDEQVLRAVDRAGKATVSSGLVDSFFGNISCRRNDRIFISRTSSSLDALSGDVDVCSLDGTDCTAITASSEYSTHRRIVTRTPFRFVLHGHPRFAVILSMDCRNRECAGMDSCYLHCPRERFFEDIPIVSGEPGTGPHGLDRTVPPAIRGRRGVMVFGHGVFTAGRKDFNIPFSNLLRIERACRDAYLGFWK
jgi:aldehyde:ferredoxin oxidoreductase